MPRVSQITGPQAAEEPEEPEEPGEPAQEKVSTTVTITGTTTGTTTTTETTTGTTTTVQEEPKGDAQGKAETYEVKIKKLAVRDGPSMESNVILVLHRGERICGVPQEAEGLPWLRLSRATMASHPQASVLDQEFTWVLMDATETDLGLGQLLERAPAELSWCASPGEQRSEVWEVAGKGGVKVTKKKDLTSVEEIDLLKPGSLVKQVELDSQDGRLRYELLAGDGPEEGWVTLDRLVQISSRRATPEGQQLLGSLDEEKVQKALQWYGKAFCHKPEANGSCELKKASFAWRAGSTEAVPAPAAAGLEQELEAVLVSEVADCCKKEASVESGDDADKTADEDLFCFACNLPLGDWFYDDKKGKVHAECMAQIMLQECKEQEEARASKEKLKIQMRHEEFGIGWSPAKIPANNSALEKLSGQKVRHGLLALALTPEGGVTLVPTACPGAAVNLEYLSAALKVRLEEGREPCFSLDPVDPKLDNTMQIKRFEPAWLKGTRAGDVLFESDYHLKELSLGQYEQPVVGMKSCFDYSDEGKFDEEWAAREWYVVRKAEVQMSEDGVLIPWCKMGVEAREQVLSDSGRMEDQRVTRPDHPLVRYAEDFSKNFDLIAERKSVVYHLRELAKASIMAKYLEQSEADLEDIWCDLYEEQEDDNCILMVPQIWNERNGAQIRVNDGKIVDDGPTDKSRAVYGGVQFGLNRLRTAPMAAGAIQARRGFIPPRMGFQAARGGFIPPRMGFQAARRGFVPPRGFVAPSSALSARRGFVAPSSALSARRGFVAPAAAISARPGFFVSPSRLSMPTMSATMPLRGVDLNLDSFNLADTPVAAREGPLALSEELDDCTAIGSAFWSHLDSAKDSVLGEEERSFLKEVFHPSLSDRRCEGELFVPPDTSVAYGDALKSLLRKEKEVRQKRKDHFLSAAFVPGEAGPLFPNSWNSQFQIDRGQAAKKTQPQVTLERHADFKEAPRLKSALESSATVFEQHTEDGIYFRIYRLGSLEVRTMQEQGDEEEIGAVFSIRECNEEPRPRAEKDEKLEKVTLYVEGSAKEPLYYVVAETESGCIFVTEKLADGTATWEENPRRLADRNSLAKVIRSADGLATDKHAATVHTLMIYQGSRTLSDVSLEARQRYAEGAFSRVARRSRSQQKVEPFESFVGRQYPRLYAFLNLKKDEPVVA